jgi:hypothetical protein
MGQRRTLFDLLAQAVRNPGALVSSAPLEPVQVDELVRLALQHRVAGQLVPAFEAAGLPIPEAVVEVRRLATLSHLQKLRALRRATDALGRAGLDVVVVKGPVLATGWYGDPAARTYHDLDLLVEPTGFSASIEALGEAGFAERNRNWSGYRSLGMGEVPMEDETVAIDLHWHVVTFAADRPSFPFRTAELLERRAPIQLGSVDAHRLSDEDTVAHTVLHAGLAGARLLIHHRDVQVVAAAVDGRAAARRIEELGVARLASATLDRVERALGPLDGVVDAVGSPVWRRVNGAVDRVWGAVVPRARNPFPSALLSSGRPTATATMRAVGVQVRRALGRHTGIRTFTSPGGPLDVDVDAGGRAERDRFLTDVERGVFGR